MERKTVSRGPALFEENPSALQQATERAEKAEAKLAELQQLQTQHSTTEPVNSDEQQNARATNDITAKNDTTDDSTAANSDGINELRKDSMMAHLLDSLDAGKDIGHYGRLVFAMIARHFLADEEVLSYLTRDRDFSSEQATLMLRQVEGRDYNPPKRQRIAEWQSEQDFPILPYPDDPDCGNVYRNLKFPESVYEHIGHYQEQKVSAGE